MYRQTLDVKEYMTEQKAEYIQALNDTRDQQDESIFPNVMLRLHNTNLQSEIDAFVASQETGTKTIGKPAGKTIGKRLGKTAGKIVELMRNNPQITIPEIAVAVQTSESNVLQHSSKLQKQGIIRRVDGRKEGYWQVIE
jgi:ATP-dependent DNA helicase RecG